jgi:hypothetical protein
MKKGSRHAPEVIERMKRAQAGRVFSEEHRANLAVGQTRRRNRERGERRPWNAAMEVEDAAVLEWARSLTDGILAARTAYLGEDGHVRREGFVYVSGPMSKLKAFGHRAFDATAMHLRSMGWNVVYPAEMSPIEDREASLLSLNGDLTGTHETYANLMARDLRMVALPNCEGIVLIEGWRRSVGAHAELRTALFLGKAVYVLKDGEPLLVQPSRLKRYDTLGVVA